MTYLLDTNACVVHIRSKGQSALSRKLNATNRREVCTCSVVRGELIVGALKSRDVTRSVAEVDAFLALFASLPFDDAAANEFARVRADLESKGTPIGAYDLMIASVALANGLTVVTHNVGEFSRVPGLAWEDWQ